MNITPGAAGRIKAKSISCIKPNPDTKSYMPRTVPDHDMNPFCQVERNMGGNATTRHELAVGCGVLEGPCWAEKSKGKNRGAMRGLSPVGSVWSPLTVVEMMLSSLLH